MERDRKTRKSIIVAVLFFFGILYGTCMQDVSAADVTPAQTSIKVAFPKKQDNDLLTQEAYTTEYLNKMSQFLGREFEVVECDGDSSDECIMNAMEMVAGGEADMMGMMLKNDAMMEMYDYPNNGYGTVYTILSALESNADINESLFFEMQNVRIAVIRGASTRNQELAAYCESNNISYTTVECESMEEQYQMLEDGKVDLMLRVSLGYCSGTKKIVEFAPRQFYFVVTKGNEELTKQIDEAIHSINEVFPFYQQDLYDAYFSDTAAGFHITDAQQSYLDKKKVLKVLCVTENAPYVFMNDKGELCGTSISVFDGFAEAAGIQVKYDAFDRSEDFAAVLKEGDYDCILATPVNASYNSRLGIVSSEPYANVEVVTFQKTNTLKKEMKDCDVAMVSGSELAEEIECREIKYYESTDECVKAVVNGETDLGYGLRSCVEYAAYDIYANLTIIPTLKPNYQIGVSLTSEVDNRLIVLLNQYIHSIGTDKLYSYLAAADAENEKNGIEIYAREHPVAAIVFVAGIAMVLMVGLGMMFLSRISAKRNQDLKKALAVKDEFLSRMSHDLRTPMNAIIGMSDLGRSSTSLEEAVGYHETVHSSGKYLLGLINDTLDMTKIESDKMVLNPKPVRITVLADMARTVLQPKAEEKEITFTIDVKGDTATYVKMDKLRVEQIFMNLLNNALKFTPRGGKVCFSMEQTVKNDRMAALKFIVCDSGVGMSREFQEKMYQPFEQENIRDVQNEAGTGLGLSIVKQLIDLMGGTIACHSEVGEGTEFIVEFEAEIVKDHVSETPESKKEETFTTLAGKRILVAEDHPLNQKVILKLLEKRGMQADCAADGIECLEIYQKQKEYTYDAILMDIRMPRMNGLDTAKAIRKMPRADAATIPIIAMTANAFQEDIDASLHAGMNEHLAKPVEPELLYRVLTNYIG